jgi:hypothetical protein
MHSCAFVRTVSLLVIALLGKPKPVKLFLAVAFLVVPKLVIARAAGATRSSGVLSKLAGKLAVHTCHTSLCNMTHQCVLVG